MHLTVKRLALLVCALVASVALAACGGGGSSGGSGGGSGGGGGGDAAADAGSGGGKVTLRAIFLPATWGTVVKETLAPQYEKETGVKVDVQLIARDAIHEKMATLFAAKDSSFDIFNLDYNWVPEFAGSGQLEPMDDVVGATDKADFFPKALQVASYDGKLYGIPQTIHPALL